MKLLSRRVPRLVQYGIFGGVALLFWLYVTFPTKAVGQRLAYEIERLSNGAVTARVPRASWSLPFSITARNVTIQIPREDHDDMQFKVDSVWAGLDALSLLTLAPRFKGGLRLGQGDIRVNLGSKPDALSIRSKLSNVDLMRPPLLANFLDIPIVGKIQAKSDLSLAKNPKNSVGQVELTLENASFGPGKLAGFTIPEALSIGRVEIVLEANEGDLRISRFSQSEGAAVGFILSGLLRMNSSFGLSTLDSCIQLKVNDESILKRSPKLDTALQLAGARFKKDSEGFLNVPLRGALVRPNGGSGIRPGKGLCGKRAKAKRKNPRNRGRPK